MRNERDIIANQPNENEEERHEDDLIDREQSEQEMKPETILLDGAETEEMCDTKAKEFEQQTVDQLQSVIESSGLTFEEAKHFPEFQQAAQELQKIHTQAFGTRAEALKKLRSPWQKSKRIMGASLMAAHTFVAACANLPIRTSLETRHQTVARIDPREVQKNALEDLQNDSNLAAEIGPENMEFLEQVLEDFDQEKINQIMAEISGVDRTGIDAENPTKIQFLSEMDLENLRKKDPGYKKNFVAVLENDEMWINASKALEFAKGDPRILRNTLIHEKLHAHTTDTNVQIAGRQVRFWDRKGIASDITEGATELVSMRIGEKMGDKASDQAYAGGELMNAYYLEHLVGAKDFAADYIEGDTKRMQAVIDEKCGPGSFETIMRENFHPLNKLLGVHLPEALLTLQNVIEQMEKAGVDPKEVAHKAEQEGMQERIEMLPENEGFFLTKDIRGELGVVNGVIDEDYKVSPNSPDVRVVVWTTGAGYDSKLAVEKNLDDILEKSERIEANYARVESEIPDEEESVKRDYAQTLSFEDLQGFNIIINSRKELAPLFEAYKQATTPEEKDVIRKQTIAESERIGREALEDFKQKIEEAKLQKASIKKTPSQ